MNSKDSTSRSDSGQYRPSMYLEPGRDGYLAVSVDLPGVMATGRTAAEAAAELVEVLEALEKEVEEALKQVDDPGKHAQVNIRLTLSQKRILERAAESDDMSLSKFIRLSALRATRDMFASLHSQ